MTTPAAKVQNARTWRKLCRKPFALFGEARRRIVLRIVFGIAGIECPGLIDWSFSLRHTALFYSLPDHVLQQLRYIVLIVVPGQAAAEGDGAGGEDAAAAGDFEIDHIGAQ